MTLDVRVWRVYETMPDGKLRFIVKKRAKSAKQAIHMVWYGWREHASGVVRARLIAKPHGEEDD